MESSSRTDPRSAKRDPAWFRLPSVEVAEVIQEGKEVVTIGINGLILIR